MCELPYQERGPTVFGTKWIKGNRFYARGGVEIGRQVECESTVKEVLQKNPKNET